LANSALHTHTHTHSHTYMSTQTYARAAIYITNTNAINIFLAVIEEFSKRQNSLDSFDCV